MTTKKNTEKEQKLNHQELVYDCPIDHKGTNLPLTAWVDPSSKKAPLILCHDLYESTLFLRPIAREFCSQGFNVYAFHLRGHGSLAKTLPFPSSLHRIALDLLQITAWVRKQEKGQDPIFIAQGFGCLVLLYLLKIHKSYIKGLILISPAIDCKTPIYPLQRALIRWCARFLPELILPAFLCPQFYIGTLKDKKKKAVRLQAKIAEQFLIATSQARKIMLRSSCPSLFIYPKKSEYYRYESVKRSLQKHPKPESFTTVSVNTKVHNLLSSKDSKIRAELRKEINSWITVLCKEDESILSSGKKIFDKILSFKKEKS